MRAEAGRRRGKVKVVKRGEGGAEGCPQGGKGGAEGCPQGGEDGTRGARAKTGQEGPVAAAVVEKAVAIEKVPTLS